MADNTRPIIRRATLQDYQSVLAISEEIYDGFDYMPVMYQYFLHSHKYYVVVWEKSGKLVALVNFQLHPDEDLVTGFSARTDKDMAGSGAIRTSGQAPLKTFLLEDYPKVEKFLAVSRIFPKLSEDSWRTYYQWLTSAYNTSTAELRSRLSENQSTHREPLFEISYSDVEEDLAKHQNMQQFLKQFVDEYVIGQWHFRPMKIDDQTEMKELFATSSKTFITVASASGYNSRDVRDLLNSPDKQITSLSYSISYPISLGLLYIITFYGQSLDCLVNHVRAQVDHVTKIYTGSIAVVIQYFDKGALNPDDVETHLRPLLGDWCNRDMKPLVLWTRKLVVTSKL